MSQRPDRAEPSVDEIIQVIKRSDLFTILTEGRDDYKIFRRFEDYFDNGEISVMPVGGRDSLLEIFDRRDETESENRIVFIADRDLWVMTVIPENYISKRLIFTNGYSIENDLYRDGKIEDLLDGNEMERFQKDLSEFLKWFAFAVYAKLDGYNTEIKCHPSKVMENGRLRESFLESINYKEVSEEQYNYFKLNYQRILRGKTLINLFLLQINLNKIGKRYSDDILLDLAARRNGDHITAIRDQVIVLFQQQAVGWGALPHPTSLSAPPMDETTMDIP